MDIISTIEAISLKPYQLKIVMLIFDFLKCTAIFAILMIALKFLSNKVVKLIEKTTHEHEHKQQLMTVKAIVFHTIQGFIFAVFLINILYIFSIDVKPILATAGVLGVAVGFGSKRLVEDVLTGLSIILEGQIRIGDYVDIEGACGIVEKITLHLITVRAVDTGALYFIRCGYIDKIINHTIGYSYAFFSFDVGYEQNLDKVFNSIKQTFSNLIQIEEYKKAIIGDIEIWGLDEFRDSSLNIKCRIKTKPKEQWTIKRIFNKMIKEQFEKENIEIPFTQIVISEKLQG